MPSASGAPRVSAVINNFNYGRYLGEAINSALAQDFPKDALEIVVVDDGSTDDSRAVIESFGAAVRPVYQRNQGQAAAVNAGIAAARGEIVCLLDGDDWWEPNKVSRVEARFRQDSSLGMVQHWTLEIDESNQPLPAQAPLVASVYRLEDFLLRETFFTGTSGLSFRKSVVEKILPVPVELFYCADEYLYTHILFEAPIGTVPEILAYHRVHGSNRYARLLADPRRIENRLKVRGVLKELLAARLLKEKAARSQLSTARERVDEAREELFLLRYQGRWREAFRSWRTGPFGWFKRSTLVAALVSPRLYLFLQSLYARLKYSRRAACAPPSAG